MYDPFDPDGSLKMLTGRGIIDGVWPPKRKSTALEKPVFVVGSPRSGTTVLGRCLGAHPQAVIGEETLIIADFWRIWVELHLGANPRSFAPLREYISSERLIDAMGTFIDSVFCGLFDRSPKAKRYVDHTPWYAGCVPLLNAIYPDCQIVHIIRDGRTVVRSLGVSYDKGFAWCGKSITERSLLWKKLVLSAQNNGLCLGADRYCEIRYETLCQNPKETLEKVVVWLGLSPADECLKPLSVSHSDPSRNDVCLASSGEVFEINPRTIKSEWQEDWSAEVIEEFKTVALSTMCALQYL